MFRKEETGRSGVLLLVLVLGIVVVVGAVLIFYNAFQPQDLDDASGATTEPSETEVVSDIEQPESVREAAEEDGEEKPLVLRTINARGSQMYVGANKVDIKMPGKGSVKAYKIAEPLNRKMRPNPREPSRHKYMPHPVYGGGAGKTGGDSPKKLGEGNEGGDGSKDNSGGGENPSGGGGGQK